jgi:large subunit ribosomal protein L29
VTTARARLGPAPVLVHIVHATTRRHHASSSPSASTHRASTHRASLTFAPFFLLSIQFQSQARSSVVSRKAVQQRGARLVVRAEGEEAEAKADALAGLKPTKCADFKSMSNDELNAQIVDAKKKLFELRMRQSTRKEYKGHHFGILKTKIAQIRTVKREREVTEGVNKRDSRKIKREERAANIYL